MLAACNCSVKGEEEITSNIIIPCLRSKGAICIIFGYRYLPSAGVISTGSGESHSYSSSAMPPVPIS